MSNEMRKTWHFGGFAFDPIASELTRNGTPVPIEPQSLRLLEYLIAHRDRFVGRGELLEAVWHGRIVSDWAISGAIKALRRALDDTDPEKRIIRTVHSRGYRFVAEAHEKTEQTLAPPEPTLLVRVFRTIGEDTQLEYLADGLAEDMIAVLSRTPGWRVLSYNTARALRDADLAPNHHITHVIDGSLRQIDGQIRINVAILDGTGTHQSWAEIFDQPRDRILAGQDLICNRLAEMLAPGTQRDVPKGRRGTNDSEAYSAYQKGRYAYFRYEPLAIIEALAHFERAAKIDPLYADALAQQAYCRTTLFVFGLPGADTSLEAAEALARQAISLDDGAALGHARLGWILGYRGRVEDARHAFDAALQRDPENAEVYHAYGETMNRLAQPDAAEALLETVFSKDSFFPPSWEFPQGHTAILKGKHTRAIDHFRSVIERLDGFIPARVQLARALHENGEETAAKAMVQDIRERAPKYSLAHARRMFPYPVDHEADRLINALKASGLPAE